MANYRLVFKSSAAKEFRKLPRALRSQITASLNQLSENPYFPGISKLQGKSNLYRLRVGDYRIVFTIDNEEKCVRIMRIRHRRDVYRKLE